MGNMKQLIEKKFHGLTWNLIQLNQVDPWKFLAINPLKFMFEDTCMDGVISPVCKDSPLKISICHYFIMMSLG